MKWEQYYATYFRKQKGWEHLELSLSTLHKIWILMRVTCRSGRSLFAKRCRYCWYDKFYGKFVREHTNHSTDFSPAISYSPLFLTKKSIFHRSLHLLRSFHFTCSNGDYLARKKNVINLQYQFIALKGSGAKKMLLERHKAPLGRSSVRRPSSVLFSSVCHLFFLFWLSTEMALGLRWNNCGGKKIIFNKLALSPEPLKFG